MNTINEKILSFIFFMCVIFGIWFFWGKEYLNRNRHSIRVGFTHETMEAMTIIALKNNFYAEQGIIVNIKEYDTGKQALEGLIKGEIDIAPTATTPFIISVINGNPLKVLAIISQADDQLKILARKSKNILKLADLTGKQIGVEKGTAAHYFMSRVLENNAIREDSIIYTFAAKPQELISLISKKKVAVITTKDPYFSQAEDRVGGDSIIFSPKKINTKTFTIVSTNKFIKNNPNTIVNFLKSLAQAEVMINIQTTLAEDQYKKYPSVSQSQITEQWNTTTFQLHMDEFFLNELVDQGNWSIANNLTKNRALPGVKSLIYTEGLRLTDVKSLIYTEGLRKANPQGQFLDF